MENIKLNKLTEDIEYIDSEMTRIGNKILELRYLIDDCTADEDDLFAARFITRRKVLIKEYIMLSNELSRLLEKRREALQEQEDFFVKENGHPPLFDNWAKDYEEEKRNGMKSAYEEWLEGINNKLTHEKGE